MTLMSTTPKPARKGRNEVRLLLAFDLGAGSGRVMLGRLDGHRLTLEETHRVHSPPVVLAGSLYWDILELFNELTRGIVKTIRDHGGTVESIGIDTIPVVSVASHDTASAISAVPSTGRDHAFISSGTWSLMGIEIDRPVITDKTLDWNYTNEGGVEGRTNLMKNIMGLWLVQECKREWDRDDRPHDYEELAKMA